MPVKLFGILQAGYHVSFLCSILIRIMFACKLTIYLSIYKCILSPNPWDFCEVGSQLAICPANLENTGLL